GSHFKIDGFDISSSSSFLPPGYPGGTQLYLGYDAEQPALVTGAQDTAGHIRTYGNEGAILATYSPDGGPVTADPRDEFGFAMPVGYLGERPDPYYSPSPDAHWSTTIDPQGAADALGSAVGPVVGYAVNTR